MKNFVGVFVLSCLMVSGAFGDNVSLRQVRGGRLLTVQGQAGGVANEIFGILEHAGLQPHCMPERTDLLGKYLASSRYGLAGESFTAAVLIDSRSSVVVNAADPSTNRAEIVLTGDAAQELYEDMEQADLPKKSGAAGNVVVGKDVRCSVLYDGSASYSCSLLAHEHPIWW